MLVTGGTGRLGRAVVELLVAAGRPVRVTSRHPAAPAREGVEHVRADLRSGEGVDAAVAGVGVVVHCATTNRRGDLAIAENLVDACRRAGGPHVVDISIVGVDRIPVGYYRAKLEVEGLLAGSGLPWTVLRTTQFHELVVRLLVLQRRLPVLVVPGVRVQPVAAREVAARLVELAGGAPAGRVPDMGGPQVLDARELAADHERARGGRRRVVAVPPAGAAGRAYRAGANLVAGPATGRVTFAEHLRAAGC